MKKINVALIARQEYDNLGVGYVSSVLKKAGYSTRILDSGKDKRIILRTLKQTNPEIVGFSIVCFGFLNDFIELIAYLRENGITSHFTAGGHYPSLKPGQLLELIPSLDSIVRFEGEETMPELAAKIIEGREWRETEGIAYIRNNTVVLNNLRALVSDIDKFPFPERSPLRKFAFNLPMATILAGRGCLNNCTFCNTRKFYEMPGGPVKRIRKPELVVEEMAMLHRKRSCSVFLFMDDDFPLKPFRNPDWTTRFCEELQRQNLSGRILWKICCRPDEIDEKQISMMKMHGLFLFFIGIEDGTDAGLKKMNKHITSAQVIESITILKKLGIGIDFGFMLYQPSTTYSSLKENIDFLKNICGDGYMPVSFLKMLPLYGTRVEAELNREGRLKDAGVSSDYDFLEEGMNECCIFVFDSMGEWLNHPYGILNLSKWIRNYFLVYSFYFGKDEGWQILYQDFMKTVAESNLFLLDTILELSSLFQSGTDFHKDDYRKKINSKHQYFRKNLHDSFNKLYYSAYNFIIKKQPSMHQIKYD